jgi:hypothetical protein
MAGRKKDDAQQASAAATVEVLGTVKRVVRRAVTAADRADLDAQLHALIEAQSSNERQQKRAQKALAKLRKRGSAIDEQIAELHSKWSAAHVEEIVSCRVERTTNEIRIVLPDGTPHYARPLTQDERVQLDSRLPGAVGDAATVHHPELDASDEVGTVEQAIAEARAKRAELSQALTFEQAIAEVDADDEAANDNDEATADVKPAKGKDKKGKKSKMTQTEMPGVGGGSNAVH